LFFLHLFKRIFHHGLGLLGGLLKGSFCLVSRNLSFLNQGRQFFDLLVKFFCDIYFHLLNSYLIRLLTNNFIIVRDQLLWLCELLQKFVLLQLKIFQSLDCLKGELSKVLFWRHRVQLLLHLFSLLVTKLFFKSDAKVI
jgi:hypothetical protein